MSISPNVRPVEPEIALDGFDEAMDQAGQEALDALNVESGVKIPLDAPRAAGSEVSAPTPTKLVTADDNRDSLYNGTSKVIAMLENRRDHVADTLRAELNERTKRNQEDLTHVEAEKSKALEVVRINSEQALAIRQTMDKDTSDTNTKIAEETEKFNQMIAGQRGVLEHLR